MKLIERRNYCIWSFQRPDPNASYREVWRGDAPIITSWAFAPRSPCGTYWDTSKPSDYYASLDAADEAAQQIFGREPLDVQEMANADGKVRAKRKA